MIIVSKQAQANKQKENKMQTSSELIEQFENLKTGKVEGWSNWYTWTVQLWIKNDEQMYNDYMAILQSITESPEIITADYVRGKVRDIYPLINPDIVGSVTEIRRFDADLFLRVLDVIDWAEIAAAWVVDWAEIVFPDLYTEDPVYWEDLYPEILEQFPQN
jgi:hypothetical protein